MSPIRSELRWLLDRAAEWHVPVRLVLPESLDQIAQWNVPCPRWTSKQVFAALHELEERGWIRFFYSAPDGKEVSVAQPELKPRALIDAYKQDRQPLYYGLTPEGATAWERAAQPKWENRYCFDVRDTSVSGETETECVVIAHDEEVARRTLLITACSHNLLVVPGTERYEPCENWQATYWKSIQHGVRGSAIVREEITDFDLESILPPVSQKRFIESYRMRWYEPVQEPAWQFREYLEHGGMWGDKGDRE